ncbi:MAG: hypothetical protein JKY55_03720 [Aliivibrio sp.]|uniref:hypothetical protein n=1 Tax=Aliivibrio sp. TaxID=1872443 RepID=UPI001A3EE43E|nr:hypothetical protein [Aliivibrio sp.]
MPSNKDIYISANIVIQQHQEDALYHAAWELFKFVDAENIDGAIVWGQIFRTIIELQNTDGDIIH